MTFIKIDTEFQYGINQVMVSWSGGVKVNGQCSTNEINRMLLFDRFGFRFGVQLFDLLRCLVI